MVVFTYSVTTMKYLLILSVLFVASGASLLHGSPYSGLSVTLATPDGHVIAKGTTDQAGKWVIDAQGPVVTYTFTVTGMSKKTSEHKCKAVILMTDGENKQARYTCTIPPGETTFTFDCKENKGVPITKENKVSFNNVTFSGFGD